MLDSGYSSIKESYDESRKRKEMRKEFEWRKLPILLFREESLAISRVQDLRYFLATISNYSISFHFRSWQVISAATLRRQCVLKQLYNDNRCRLQNTNG